MSRTSWSGNTSRRERARWAPIVNAGGAVCCRCGRLIVPNPQLRGDGWQPDHWPIPRELGGTETLPAHSRCNESAGGKRGAQLTNAKRRAERRRAAPPYLPNRNIRGV